MDQGDYQLKFVITQPGDVDEMEGMLASLQREIPRDRVLLMPEGVTLEQIRAKAGWLGDLCKQRGYRYAHRLQIELYGNKRGT
jgi:7-carboxy-7-deazaguanine synthase